MKTSQSHYFTDQKNCIDFMYQHSMALGNLNKSKETKPTTNTALEDHFPQELKSPFRTSLHKVFKTCFL